MEQSLSLSYFKKLRAFYGTERFITVFTRAESIQFTSSHAITLKAMVISSHLFLGLNSFPLSSLFTSDLKPNPGFIFLSKLVI
jgi:hypothetical protein